MALCIYHGGCDDGFASAWVMSRHADLSEVRYVFGRYGKPPQLVLDMAFGEHVYLVDFSYKREAMRDLCEVAERVTVLDHHASAERELRPLFEAQLIDGVFDMERSGCAITWDYFVATNHGQRPWLLEYIQDRDLWRKDLPDGDKVIMALRSYPQDFSTWDAIIERGPDALREEGEAIHRYYRTVVEALHDLVTYQLIGGEIVPVVNAPYQFASELAGELCQRTGAPFAATYWLHPDGVSYSLRSREGGRDVSKVAEIYGGGGHPGASGFRTRHTLPSMTLDGQPTEIELERSVPAEHLGA